MPFPVALGETLIVELMAWGETLSVSIEAIFKELFAKAISLLLAVYSILLLLELLNLTLIVLLLKSKASLEGVVFNLTIPSLSTFAFITAKVPLLFTPDLSPFREIAKDACPLFILPLAPSGVRTELLPNTLPLLILWTSNILGSYRKSTDPPYRSVTFNTLITISIVFPTLVSPFTVYEMEGVEVKVFANAILFVLNNINWKKYKNDNNIENLLLKNLNLFFN